MTHLAHVCESVFHTYRQPIMNNTDETKRSLQHGSLRLCVCVCAPSSVRPVVQADDRHKENYSNERNECVSATSMNLIFSWKLAMKGALRLPLGFTLAQFIILTSSPSSSSTSLSCAAHSTCSHDPHYFASETFVSAVAAIRFVCKLNEENDGNVYISACWCCV